MMSLLCLRSLPAGREQNVCWHVSLTLYSVVVRKLLETYKLRITLLNYYLFYFLYKNHIKLKLRQMYNYMYILQLRTTLTLSYAQGKNHKV